jgi:hypothetical protein
MPSIQSALRTGSSKMGNAQFASMILNSTLANDAQNSYQKVQNLYFVTNLAVDDFPSNYRIYSMF